MGHTRTEGAAGRPAGRHRTDGDALLVHLVLVVVLLLLIVLVACRTAQAQSPFNPQTYKLTPGDRIGITVFGQPELSGELVIDGTGSVILPFLGEVQVADLTLGECQKRIVERLADGILSQPSVSVRIAELRPVFLVGDVRTGGSQPYRFGMNVKMAIAAAGGFGASIPNQGNAVPELLASDERVRQLSLQKQALGIRKARLEAQLDGAASFTPPEVRRDGSERTLSDIVAFEKETFESQAAIQQSQVDLLRAQQPRISNEIDALRSQIDTRKVQLDLVKKHVEQYGRLVKQGLGLSNMEMQLRLTEATYESEIWNLTGQVARLRMDLGALDLRIQESEAAFKRQVLAELREVRERLQDLDVTLPTAREIRAAKLQQVGSLGAPEGVRTVKVMRTRNGQATEFQAEETTPLEPGDIVEVQVRLPGGPVLPDPSAFRSGGLSLWTPDGAAQRSLGR